MIGSTVSHYSIVEHLGGGGMGIVYKAKDLKLDRFVALKFLPPELTRDPDSRERFIHEAKAASALQHNNICTVHDIDQTPDGQMFIVMDLYEGETLKQRIERGAMTLNEVAEIAAQVADGLAEAHEHGIIHRDVKPANIFLTKRGGVKIVDFGVAKLAGRTAVTRAGTTIGTVAYMSPEQARGEAIDARTDVWALGVVLYEMASGRLPFRGEHESAIVYSILNETPEPVTKLRSELPGELDRIVNMALSKDPGGRYPTAHEMSDALVTLRRAIASRSVSAANGRGIPGRRRYRTAAVVLGILLLASLVLILWPVTDRDRAGRMIAELQTEIDNGRFDTVYEAFSRATIDLQDPDVREAAKSVIGTFSLETDPPKAAVTLAYVYPLPTFSAGPSLPARETPLENYAGLAGEYIVKMALEGYVAAEFLLHLRPADSLHIRRTLPPATGETSSMVQVVGGISSTANPMPTYLIDKYEVTNDQYFQFVSAGGYNTSRFWDTVIVADNRPLPWASARKRLVDQTGLPGPRFWTGGRFPGGKERHPVVGVSWYEAMAYARWAGKNLPNADEWWFAALGGTRSAFPWGDDVRSIPERANFKLLGTETVGSYPLGVSPFGCYDMAGNVKEWLRDRFPRGTTHSIVGGSWRDESYMFESVHAESFEPFFSTRDVGFRCVKALTDKR